MLLQSVMRIIGLVSDEGIEPSDNNDFDKTFVLILDEVLEIVQKFNNTQLVQTDIKQQISDADIELLIAQKLISIDDNKLVQKSLY